MLSILTTFLATVCDALRQRADLLLENAALRQQLDVLCRQAKGSRLRRTDRVFWIWLSRRWPRWKSALVIVKPETVLHWHSEGYRRYWRWKSGSGPGRPPIPKDMKDLIRRLSGENPLWGAERIRGTLLLLGYDSPCEDTIRKYMIRSRKPREKSPSWLPFLRNHLDVSWAIDFFTVTTIHFSTLYVFLIFDHGRRKVIHFATTYQPSMKWVIQQLRDATPFGHQPRYIFRDNDSIYGRGVSLFLKHCGIQEVRTAYQCPWQNPFLERFIGTLRRELLDHVIVLTEEHLKRVLSDFINQYYHVSRPHQGLKGDTPIPQITAIDPPRALISIPVVGGLHHRYVPVAA